MANWRTKYNTWRLVRKLRKAEYDGNVILCNNKGIQLDPRTVLDSDGFQEGCVAVRFTPPFLTVLTPETTPVAFFTPYPEQQGGQNGSE